MFCCILEREHMHSITAMVGTTVKSVSLSSRDTGIVNELARIPDSTEAHEAMGSRSLFAGWPNCDETTGCSDATQDVGDNGVSEDRLTKTESRRGVRELQVSFAPQVSPSQEGQIT